jgi:tRNA(Ile)-lysidine synthase TilS/MesJ
MYGKRYRYFIKQDNKAYREKRSSTLFKRCQEPAMTQELDTYQKIERSIITKYRKSIWKPFVAAVKRYELIEAGDKIAVCISGGKDSMLMAKLMQELHRHSDVPFGLVFLVMDPGYNEINRQKIESNAALLHIPITVFETNVFEVANNADKSPCYLCAKMRRGHLYSKAREMGCNKIALGHHMSDVIETTVMGMFYGSQLQAMPPKLHSKNFVGMELIRPMYCILEEDILAWKRYNDLEFIQCACRFTENCTMCDNGGGGSKRQEIKILLRHLKKDNPNIEKSIFNSIHSVCLDTMVEYKENGIQHSFLEKYYDKG